ncbi:MAG TPA: CDP-alcohol phosphatidyltransferase family protein [Bryobacteraceae bacterium]|nr:CDP-alcohol phosphatidyltransferase family protein [Bryobacteraceae bacterium]
MNPANLLSAARLALTPPVVAWIVAGSYRQALILLAVAGATDGADGLLARRYGWQTRLGAYLDPIADKVLLAAVYLALGFVELLPWWLVTVVFARDLAILCVAGAILLWTDFRNFRPSRWGKLSTTFQILTALAALAAPALESRLLAAATRLLIPAAGACTVWSGLHYAWQIRRALSAGASRR